MNQQLEAEVCVLGGGPAGATVAGRLAYLGRDVLVVDAGKQRTSPVVESLSASCLPLIELLGVGVEVRAAALAPPLSAIISWETEPVALPASDQQGLLIDRRGLDRILLQACRRAGARAIAPCRVLRVDHRSDGGWDIPIDVGGRRQAIRAKFLVDASGRRRLIRAAWLSQRPRTLALSGIWEGAYLPETRLEAAEDRWYWGAPAGPGSCTASVFIDHEVVRCTRRQSVETIYHELIRTSRLLSCCLKGRLLGSVRACDATSGQSAAFATDELLRVGDAAYAVDPLSSQGLSLAIGGALQAAVVVNTIIGRPPDRDLAINFYCQRQKSKADACLRQAEAVYRRASIRWNRPFWIERSGAVDPSIAEPESRALLGVNEMVRLSPAAAMVLAGVLRGNWIEQELA